MFVELATAIDRLRAIEDAGAPPGVVNLVTSRSSGMVAETIFGWSGMGRLFVDVLKSFTVEGTHLGGLLERTPEPRSQVELRRLLEEAVEQILGAMLQADYISPKGAIT